MIASIVWDVDPILFKVGSWEVRWYGLMWGLGFILAYEMVSRLFKKEKYPEEWWTSFLSMHSQYGHWRPSGALSVL